MRWVVTVLGVVGAVASLGANRYVTPSGSDGNACSQNSPCRTVQRGIDVMQNGDTLIIADGTYTGSGTSASGCGHNHNTLASIRSKNCSSGCTVRAENVDGDDPRVTLSGSQSGVYISDSNGWTVEGILFDAPAGIHLCNSTDLTIRDSIVHFQQEPAQTYYGARLANTSRVTLDRVKIHEKTKYCWVRKRGPDSSAHRGLFVSSSTDLLFQDVYVGFTTTLGNLSDVQRARFNRVHFQHWGEHGLTMSEGTADLTFDNVIWGGRAAGHCWNGSQQSSLTDTACYTNSDCALEPAGATVCRVDDCYCVRHSNADPPYCGTCDPEPNAPWDKCWRGTRALDVYEVDGLTVRNNSFVGHGYMPISSIYRNFTDDNAHAQCTTYPGVCESNTSLSCSQSQGDSYCNSRGAGRCIPICEVKNYKFYNNIVYDLSNLAQNKSPGFVKVPTNNAWNRHSVIRIDGNVYSGGEKVWSGCNNMDSDIIRSGRFGPDDEGRCWNGTLESFTQQSCTANNECPTNRCNNVQWQGSVCYGLPLDQSSYWYADIESSFANYGRENYEPTSATAVMVDAGINGTDPEGVRRCADTDFSGKMRTDGQCDIGAFEWGEGPPDDPVDDPPPTVENLDRSDSHD